MKRIISLAIAILLLCTGMISCGNGGKDFLTYNYDYDLSEYIEVPNYKDYVAIASPASIDEETYVNIQIQSSLAYYARQTEVDRAALMNDTVLIDSNATIDGKAFAGGTTKNYTLRLGSETIGKEFESKLVGYSAGAHVKFSISVADDEKELPELRGKTVNYEVDILKVYEDEYPEYNDVFVKAYLGHDTVEDYENYLREQYEENNKRGVYSDVVPQVWEFVFDNSTVIKYPQKELKEKYDNMVSGVQDYADIYGMTLEAFVKGTFDMTLDEFYQYAQTEAEADVKEEMICYAIARAENLTLSEEEYVERATEIATNIYGMETLKELEEKFNMAIIYKGILMDMAKETIADSCNIIYSDPGTIITPNTGNQGSQEHDHDHDHDHE